AIAYLVVFVAIPVTAIVHEGLQDGVTKFAATLTEPNTLAALSLTLKVAAVMAVVNAVMGTWIAYVLVRVPFPGRSLLNAIVDLPFAIPTLVTGVMLVVLFGPQSPIGGWAAAHGTRIMYAPPG